jgi:hypothetical protein
MADCTPLKMNADFLLQVLHCRCALPESGCGNAGFFLNALFAHAEAI